MTRRKKRPSDRDLAIWATAREDLLDRLYTGLTGIFQIAGHRYIDRWTEKYRAKYILEVGCGHGHHLRYSCQRFENYIGLDIEKKFLRTFRQRFPTAIPINGDAYALPLQDASIDCIVSIYNLEHLRQLSACLIEIRRVLKPGGEFLIGIPAEGGLLYRIGRNLTSKRYMQRKYGIDYDAIVQWEHWNTFRSVLNELKVHFTVERKHFIPFPFIPVVDLNIIGCLRARPRMQRSCKWTC